MPTLDTLRADARAILTAAIDACDPGRLLTRALAASPLPPHVNVLAAGKASAAMLDGFFHAYAGRVAQTLVAAGAHPVPDQASMESGAKALRLAAQSRTDGVALVVLLSGGASAMLSAPARGLTAADKMALTRVLLASGLGISDVNCVRKHVSAIKGGQLAAAAGETMTYAISDVHSPIEDDPAVIGSGPTVADPSTFADAVHVLRSRDEWRHVPERARAWLEAGILGYAPETPKPGDARLADARFVLTGSRRDAMAGAAGRARALGYTVVMRDAPIVGEARRAAVGFVRDAAASRAPSGGRVCVVASGETTVRLATSSGRGGRNQEFALAAATHLGPLGPCVLASAGTDGVDGPTDAAGAVADSTTLQRAAARGLDGDAALAGHASYDYFESLGDLIVTGPTGTNVGDVQVMLFGE